MVLLVKYHVITTIEFDNWLAQNTEKDKQQIMGRISHIEIDGYFGNHKSVSHDNSIWELKWDNGRRIYYTYLPEENVLLLLGGNKNGQNKDIWQAKKIFAKVTGL